MKTIIHKTDYYPLFRDLRDFPKKESVRKELVSTDALISFAIANKLTPFQSVILIVKNTFESHCYLLHDIKPENLRDEGLSRVTGLQGGSLDLSCDFYQYLASYTDGLQQTWQILASQYQLEKVCVESLLHFILAHQLYRFPVVHLQTYDICDFQNISSKNNLFFKQFSEIICQVNQALAELNLIEQVDSQYKERFDELLRTLNSKEQQVIRLDHKIELLLDDPGITTEEELESRYFMLFVKNEIRRNSRRSSANVSMVMAGLQDIAPNIMLAEEIRSLYRQISINCKEVHGAAAGKNTYNLLRDYFLRSNFVYNENGTDLLAQILQWTKLINILTGLINFRHYSGYPIFFKDFTARNARKGSLILTSDIIIQIRVMLEKHLSDISSSHAMVYKLKHLVDEELAELHQEFLIHQIDFFNQKINEKLGQIKAILLEQEKRTVNP